MKLYFIRHGETVWNTQAKLQGKSDIPLNEKGVALARVTGEALAALLEKKRPAVFYSSDLCARYFTCLREGESHFILFDDRETLEKKRTLALELGIRRFFLLYPEIADLWEVPSQEG